MVHGGVSIISSICHDPELLIGHRTKERTSAQLWVGAFKEGEQPTKAPCDGTIVLSADGSMGKFSNRQEKDCLIRGKWPLCHFLLVYMVEFPIWWDRQSHGV